MIRHDQLTPEDRVIAALAPYCQTTVSDQWCFADLAHDRIPDVLCSTCRNLVPIRVVILIDSDGVEVVKTQLSEFIQNPAYRHRNIQAEINILGYRLMGASRMDDALAIFQFNVDEFPDSWNVYDSLAEAHELRGDLAFALDQFRKSLAINPTSPSGLAAVQRLEGQVGSSTSAPD